MTSVQQILSHKVGIKIKPNQPAQAFNQYKYSKGWQETPKKVLQKTVVKKSYRWTRQQHNKYVRFLAQNIHLFKMNYLDKMKMKIHVRMSEIIPNRTSYQCRSHHQKMLLKYGSIDKVLQNFAYLLPDVNSTIAKQPHQKSQVQVKVESPDKYGYQCKVEEQNQMEYQYFPYNVTQKDNDLIPKEEDQIVYKTFN